MLNRIEHNIINIIEQENIKIKNLFNNSALF